MPKRDTLLKGVPLEDVPINGLHKREVGMFNLCALGTRLRMRLRPGDTLKCVPRSSISISIINKNKGGKDGKTFRFCGDNYS